MDCEEAGHFLDSYLDSELETSLLHELEQHLDCCSSCSCLAQEGRECRVFLKTSARTFKAPPELRTKVLAAVRREKKKLTFAFLRQPLVYAAAVLVLSLSLTLNHVFPDLGKEDSREALLRHSSSISADHLVDILSANPQVVKSWLSAKLDFSPPVISFPSPAYSLLGGRVDVIQNHSVATVVYKSDKDVVSLFCWPTKKEQILQRDYSSGGYHVSTWSNAECNYILISKLSDRRMNEFIDSFRDQVQAGSLY
jgi:anti-sigma factor (TIGR02949 family)